MTGISDDNYFDRGMYSYLKERIKHAVRFRHKRGYGVHSPFMFNLILNVIRDKGKRFDYPRTIERQGKYGHRERKLFRLLYRLAFYLKCRNILCSGRYAETLVTYLSYLSQEKQIGTDKAEIEQADFIFIGRDAGILEGKLFIAGCNEARCIVIMDIYKNKANARLWRKGKSEAKVAVDMMWYGILFFDPKLQPGRYNLMI